MATEGSKRRKQANLKAGEAELEELVAFDYQVVQLSPYHFRINGRLDVWPSSKRWWDCRTFGKGDYQDLVAFVKAHLPQKLSPGGSDGSL